MNGRYTPKGTCLGFEVGGVEYYATKQDAHRAARDRRSGCSHLYLEGARFRVASDHAAEVTARLSPTGDGVVRDGAALTLWVPCYLLAIDGTVVSGAGTFAVAAHRCTTSETAAVKWLHGPAKGGKR